MPAFGGEGQVAVAVPGQVSLAEPGARGDHGDRAAADRHALLQGVQVLFLEVRDGVSQGSQVIDQPGGFQVKRVVEDAFVDHPGQIGDLRAAVNHRSGDGEHRVGGIDPGLADEIAYQGLEARVAGAGKAFFMERIADATGFVEKGEGGLGASDVSGQKHQPAPTFAASSRSEGSTRISPSGNRMVGTICRPSLTSRT